MVPVHFMFQRDSAQSPQTESRTASMRSFTMSSSLPLSREYETKSNFHISYHCPRGFSKFHMPTRDSQRK